MTDNDYIAEYIKEKHPGFIGFDFAMWKMARYIVEGAKAFEDIIANAFSCNPEET